MVASIRRFERFNDYDLNLYFQDPLGVADQIHHRDSFANVFITGEMEGCHGARVNLLRHIQGGYDVYINLDDDMELTEHTNYEPAIIKALEPSTGFVLTNWARTRGLMEKKIPRKREEFIRQNLIYQGGGMVYCEKIAALMRELPAIKQTFDHAWPLTAYINGYLNYRYMGSLAIHRVCGTGGMAGFMTDNPVQLMMTEYVNIRKAKRQRGNAWDVCIPLDPDIKPLAHEKHRANFKG
jgi:hypothetical protein